MLEECLAEIKAMYYKQLSHGQHIFWYISHQAHLGDSFVSFLPLYFISWVKIWLWEIKRERERERLDEHDTMSKIKKKKRMAMEINVRGPSWIEISFIFSKSIWFKDIVSIKKVFFIYILMQNRHLFDYVFHQFIYSIEIKVS